VFTSKNKNWIKNCRLLDSKRINLNHFAEFSNVFRGANKAEPRPSSRFRVAILRGKAMIWE
jgi:hypothetical protein